MRGLNNSLHRVNHFIRRRVAFDLKPAARRVNRTSEARQLDAIGGLANIGRTQIEALARSKILDPVEKFAAQRFHARDVTAARRHEFLHQCGLIYAKIDRARCRRTLERIEGFVKHHAGTAAADICLYHDGKAQISRGVHRK